MFQGKFYELYELDAEIGQKELDWKMTISGVGKCRQVEASKKKVKETNVPVAELVYGGMAPADLQTAVEKEFDMALQDTVMEETKEEKNAVEAYVYEMRNKLHDKYQDFVTATERDELTGKLQEVEDWLYEDGEDETKGVYVAKLEELKKQGNPIEERHREWIERGPAIDQLIHCINSYREAALSNNPNFLTWLKSRRSSMNVEKRKHG